MKKVIAIVSIVCLANVVNAQAFQNKGNYLQVGFGAQAHSLGPISVGYERGITGLIGIGRFGVGGKCTLLLMLFPILPSFLRK